MIEQRESMSDRSKVEDATASSKILPSRWHVIDSTGRLPWWLAQAAVFELVSVTCLLSPSGYRCECVFYDPRNNATVLVSSALSNSTLNLGMTA